MELVAQQILDNLFYKSAFFRKNSFEWRSVLKSSSSSPYLKCLPNIRCILLTLVAQHVLVFRYKIISRVKSINLTGDPF